MRNLNANEKAAEAINRSPKMPLTPNDTVLIEDARIIFRNFAGKEGPMNRAGDRNFCVLLDPEIAETLNADGWNVKVLEAREEGEEPQPYIQVAVSYKVRPPVIAMITSRGRTELDEDVVDLLDYADIVMTDLIFQPYNWEMGGKTGVKAYLKSLFVTVREDALEEKYGNIPKAGQTPHEAE